MIETSKDILNIVIAFCALWITVFICWAMYYLLITLKNAKEIVQGVKKRIDEIENLIKTVKQKTEHLAAPMTILNETAKQIIPLIKKYRERHAESKKARKQKSNKTKKQKSKKTKKQ